MTFSRTSRRWITPAVLAGYVLVITFSGLFHQHEGGCCRESGCSQAQASHRHEAGHEEKSTCHGHSHHRHDHYHACADHSQPAAGEAPARRPSEPRNDDPLKHANCAACQLLAEQSLNAPTFALECAGIAVFRDVAATEIRIPFVLAATHPARGPPSAG